MHNSRSRRPYAAAGIALVGAGVIAAAPVVAPPLPDIEIRAAAPSVALTAETDVLTRWVEAFNTASENATALSQFYFEAPGAALQQAIVNQVGYFGDVLNDPGSIGTVLQTISGNLQNAFNAATMQGLPDDINQAIPILAVSNDVAHTVLVGFVPGFLPEGTPEFVTPLIHFLASPISGVMIGLAGPLVSPAVAALNSILAGDLLNLPANMVDGFFNGATLSLDALLPVIAGAGVLPEGTTFNKLGIAFGGLFSPGATAKTVGGQIGLGAVGGSLFSSLDLSITSELAPGFPVTLDAPGVGIGPIGALANLSQMIAGGIGWDGDGNPLTKLAFPKLETETPSPMSAIDAQEGPAALPSAPSRSVSFKVSSDADAGPVEEAPAADDLAAHEEGEDDTAGTTANGATDLSEGNKATPGETRAKAGRLGQRLKAGFEDRAQRLDDLQKRVSTSLKKVSGSGGASAGNDTESSVGAAGGEGDSDSAS